MIEIYHNPRCRKSREGLAIVEASGKDFEIVRYLDEVPTATELKGVLNKLGMSAEQLVRKNNRKLRLVDDTSIYCTIPKGMLTKPDDLIAFVRDLLKLH